MGSGNGTGDPKLSQDAGALHESPVMIPLRLESVKYIRGQKSSSVMITLIVLMRIVDAYNEKQVVCTGSVHSIFNDVSHLPNEISGD